MPFNLCHCRVYLVHTQYLVVLYAKYTPGQFQNPRSKGPVVSNRARWLRGFQTSCILFQRLNYGFRTERKEREHPSMWGA